MGMVVTLGLNYLPSQKN